MVDFLRPRYILLSLQKQVLSAQNTPSIHLYINHIYLIFCVGNTISVSFIEFLRKFCVHDKTFDKVATMLGKRVIKFERLKIMSNFTYRLRLIFVDLVTF